MVEQQSEGCFKKRVTLKTISGNNESGDFTWLSCNRSCSILASFILGKVKRLEQNIPLCLIWSINCKWWLLCFHRYYMTAAVRSETGRSQNAGKNLVKKNRFQNTFFTSHGNLNNFLDHMKEFWRGRLSPLICSTLRLDRNVLRTN